MLNTYKTNFGLLFPYYSFITSVFTIIKLYYEANVYKHFVNVDQIKSQVNSLSPLYATILEYLGWLLPDGLGNPRARRASLRTSVW